jgi:hypothetical protein
MNKKNLLIIITVFALLGVTYYLLVPKQPVVLQSQSAQETDKHLVEIFHLPHAPAVTVVKKVEEILKKYPEYTVKEYDFDNESSNTKVAEYGLEGHMPVAIFIGGKNTFTINGAQVSFQNFPKGDSFIPGFEGPWSYGDLEQVLTDNK